MTNQDGLEWSWNGFPYETIWRREPDVDTIRSLARKHLGVEDNTTVDVAFFAKGSFNKLYKISSAGWPRAYIFRVTLPVDPHHKTVSEVATLRFVRMNTSIPVPEVIAFDASNENDLKFEWILMEKVPGEPLQGKWKTMSWQAKEELARQLARHAAQLFNHKWDRIGNLHQIAGDDRPAPGRLVSTPFFIGHNIKYDVPRGPFENSYRWFHSQLELIMKEQDRILQQEKDEDFIEEAKRAKKIVGQLFELLPRVFQENEQEETVLFHDDLSMQNILVDEEGKLAGIVDWECVSTLPLWYACTVPKVLVSKNRQKELKSENYCLDDENTLYWEHLEEYELTKLRGIFVEEMEKWQPQWTAEWEKAGNGSKVDFDLATDNCTNELCGGYLRVWFESIEERDGWRLKEALLGDPAMYRVFGHNASDFPSL